MLEILESYLQGYLAIHVALAPIVSIILRAASVVLAPIPGTPVDLVNITLFGKNIGFIYGEISIVIGSIVNFYIARKFGQPAVSKFVPIDKISVWEERINEKSGFWGLVVIRMFSIPIFDYLSYVAGLTRMSFSKFFLSSILSSILPMWVFYYLGETFLKKGLVWASVIIAVVVLLYFLFQRGKIFKRFSEYLRIRNGK